MREGPSKMRLFTKCRIISKQCFCKRFQVCLVDLIFKREFLFMSMIHAVMNFPSHFNVTSSASYKLYITVRSIWFFQSCGAFQRFIQFIEP